MIHKSSRRRWLPAGFALLVWAVPLAGGEKPANEKLATDKLTGQIAAVIEAPEFKHAHWGLLVVDLQTGSPIYELNPDHLFAPASVTKLYSVATALDAFGADHRFETPVYARGETNGQGVLAGDLILVATGDLTLGGRTTADGQIAFTNSDHTYANGSDKGELTAPDPLAGLDELAKQVAAGGIKRVKGEVLIDDRLFDKETGSGSGPRRVTPIVVNDNLVDLTITPTAAGQPATVSWRPQSAIVQVDARVETVAVGQPLAVTLRGDTTGGLVVRGSLPAGHKPLVRVYEVPDAAAFARALFIEALRRAGVEVDASPLIPPPNGGALPPHSDYARLKALAKFTSPPFSENVRLILKVSHNLHASSLPLLVAARQGGRSLADGLKKQNDFLARSGIDADSISFGGGAGGASADFVTPRATVELLRSMHARPDVEVFKRALPILGVDGTLSESVGPECPARGKFVAKTGTLYWENLLNDRLLLTSKALAGYGATSAGRPVAFAFFVNNVHLPQSAETGRIGKTLGKLCEIIYAAE
ncbi:MAG: D-alanyl-D-alanine carboxypeptidase/D-alanyl-D-alanine-endopeptidase [Planctomycetaceae bacterium]|nr:D-alanyl-D-alanine carboxypeptidase/D-alanyl-D-alanine-endopeptidase [Planctomycetaceae bacterium]